MSTRSDVSIVYADGTVVTQYYHMDGNLSFSGQKLLDNYKTLKDANLLIEMGSHDDSHVMNNPQEAMDQIHLGEMRDLKIAEPSRNKYKSLSNMISSVSQPTDDNKYISSDIEYHYLYSPNEQGKYQWNVIKRDGIEPLTQKLIDQERGSLAEVNWNKSKFTQEWGAPLTDEEKKRLDESLDKQNRDLKHYQELNPNLAAFMQVDMRTLDWFEKTDFYKEPEMNKTVEEKTLTPPAKYFPIEQELHKKGLPYFSGETKAFRNLQEWSAQKYGPLNSYEKEDPNLEKFSVDLANQVEDQAKKHGFSKQDQKQVDVLKHLNLKQFEQISEQIIANNGKSEKRTFDRNAWKKKHTQTVEDLKNGLLKEVENYTQSPEKVVEMLDFMSKFHNYSERNAMLIHMQRPGATAVGSYAKFKKMGYNVNKGEKGIKIFVPTKATVFYRQDKDGNKNLTSLRNATKDEKQKIKSGNIETYQKTFYKIGTVFDAPQTNMPKEKYPELYPNRHQDFDMKSPGQLDLLEKGLRSVADDMKMPVVTYNPFNADIRDKYKDPQNAKGYFNRATNEIVLNGNNTPTENVSVLAHELGHAQLHNSQKQEKDLPRELKEMQAELTSYLYCSRYGIDTKQETVDYIANWTSNGQKFNELPSGVKGQILTHVGSATKTLTNSTDKLLEKEQEKLGQIVKENFLDTPEHSQWYVQKEKMEQEVTDNETNGTNFKTELTALRKIEKSMTVDTVRNLNDAFNKTQCWTADGNYSKLTDNLQNEIEKNQEKSKLLDDKEVQTSKPHVATVNSSLTNEKAKEIAIQKGEQELDR
ncbi:ArdC-like ssDNA-binding domain-containing protein [Lactobacillus crispatus]|uniref:ArdC-like ssDNA-binding domain-containing protein n=1 Tax=Lactobacillus crispatus TaxID=47770 RepID=UPI0001B2AAF4|nr:ArdC-like ssDNA-binding domain-containing protein [Lactobacillus crispatus]EEU29361.1 hypothetical protein HMPREF0507_00215 [Lactobacillus crispatus MV-1A-US]